MSVEKTPEQQARAERAQRSLDALSIREPQQKIYESVTFPADHIVGAERTIPLFNNELILAPGHLDILYKLGVVHKDELYKVTQTSLREGVQYGMNSTVTFRGELATEGGSNTMKLEKAKDLVFGKIDVSKILQREALSHPDVQAIFLQMIEQQAGTISLRFQVDLTRKLLSHLQKQPNSEDEVRALRTESEIACRRIVMQKFALHKMLQTLPLYRPEMAEIYKLNGESLFVESIDAKVVQDLGTDPQKFDPEYYVQRIISSLFDQKK